jgi:hypothetical protein
MSELRRWFPAVKRNGQPRHHWHVYLSRWRAAGQLGKQVLALAVSWSALVVMDREAAGSGGCSTTFHGRLGAGVTISIDAVPVAFGTGLIRQHPICYQLFNAGRGLQGNSHATTTAAAHAAKAAKAVQQVYERFETACDDLDSGLFHADDLHCYCCMLFFDGAGGSESRLEDGRRFCSACSYQVHGKGTRGGQHNEFATTARPNDRCPAGCSGCTA